MSAGQKPFKKKPSTATASSAKPKKTPRARQYAVGEQPAKKVVGYKISATLPAQIELAAQRLQADVGRKVWPAHIVEAAINAFLDLDEKRQRTLIES